MADFRETILALVKGRSLYTLREVAMLLHLRDMPLTTVRAAAAALGVQKPVITRCMDRLQLDGLAVRKVDESDRRSVLLGLTKKGEKMVAKWA
jgi:DNA-binding MarR family transcriptional regulator